MIKPLTIDRNTMRGYNWALKRLLRKYVNKNQSLVNRGPSIAVIRLDDVGFDVKSAQLAIMDVFLMKDEKISLGLVLNSIDDDPTLIREIQDGYDRGIFELVLHGFYHVDYTKLTEQEQECSLLLAYRKMKDLFGEGSKIFIPPYNRFNSSTLRAMNKIGLRVISSMLNYEIERDIFTAYKGRADRNLIYHLPEMASFETWDKQGNPIRTPVSSILKDIEINICRYGYAIITLHPITFVKFEGNNITNLVDESQINDLRILIDSIKSKNITITSFSKLAEIG